MYIFIEDIFSDKKGEVYTEIIILFLINFRIKENLKITIKT